MKPLSIFLGYDPREHEAYRVAYSSIDRRASQPVLISPLYLPHLTHIMTRHIQRTKTPNQQPEFSLWCPISEAPMSTEFANSRFCVPFIQESGWALFADCDVLCLGDISDLFALADDRYAVMVVKHNYQPDRATKMDGQIQTQYNRKLWSSVVLWNCSHIAHRRLTRERLNNWPGRDLHAFKWLEDDEIGDLPPEWNHLVGIDPIVKAPQLLHFTLGGPWFPDSLDCGYNYLWLAERDSMNDMVMV